MKKIQLNNISKVQKNVKDYNNFVQKNVKLTPYDKALIDYIRNVCKIDEVK